MITKLLRKNQRRVLIDTWWNVNDQKAESVVEQVDVLIDTWWNVNQEYPYFNLTGVSVLIDTWWNVNNQSAAQHNKLQYSFNRYMVECE